MEYEKIDTKKAKLSTKSLLLLLLSIIILPFCILTPFLDHTSKLVPVLGFSSIDGLKPGCIANGNLVAHNQCATWSEPNTIWPLAALLLIGLVGFSVLLSFYTLRLNHKDGKLFANYRFVTVFVVSIISFMVFAIMRNASQNHDSYDFGLVSANLAKGASLAQQGPYVPDHVAAFGYGITPGIAILLIAGFVLPAFFSWHKFIFSRKHVDGQKKKELFR